MSRKQKNKKTAIVLSAVLLVIVLAIGGWLIYEKFSQAEDESGDIPLISLDATLITEVEITHDGETMSLFLDEDVWRLRGDSAFPLDQAMVLDIVESAADIAAVRMLDSAESEFGLDDPHLTLRVVTATGDEHILYIGNQNPQTFEYYVSRKSGTVVYTVAQAYFEHFDRTPDDLAQIESIPTVISSLITCLRVERGNSFLQVRQDDGGLDAYDFTGSSSYLATGSGVSAFAATPVCVSEFIDTFTGLVFVGLAEYDIGDDDLYRYGFDLGNAKIVMDYSVSAVDDSGNAVITPKRFVLLVGTIVEGGYTFVMEQDADVIYYVDTDEINALLNYSAESLVQAEVCALGLDYIKSMDIVYGEKSASVTVTTTRSVGEDGTETVAYSYSIDGEKLDGELFVSFFNCLHALTWQTVSDKPVGQPLLSISFATANAFYPRVDFKLAVYDGSFYVSSINGEAPLLINKRSVDEMLTNLESAMDGRWEA